MAGVLRNIAELEHFDPENYKDNIGVVLVADGTDKIDPEFYKNLIKYGLISQTVLKQNAFKEPKPPHTL